MTESEREKVMKEVAESLREHGDYLISAHPGCRGHFSHSVDRKRKPGCYGCDHLKMGYEMKAEADRLDPPKPKRRYWLGLDDGWCHTRDDAIVRDKLPSDWTEVSLVPVGFVEKVREAVRCYPGSAVRDALEMLDDFEGKEKPHGTRG